MRIGEGLFEMRILGISSGTNENLVFGKTLDPPYHTGVDLLIPD